MTTIAEFFRDDKGRDKVYIQIVGEKTDITRDVRPADIKNFPEEWKRYQTGGSFDKIKGTPLTKLESITGGMPDFLSRNGVFTVEQLADIPDITCQQFGMGWLTIRNDAKKYVAEHGKSDEEIPVAPPTMEPSPLEAEKRRRAVLKSAASLKTLSEAEKDGDIKKED